MYSCGTVYYGGVFTSHPAFRACATFVNSWEDSNGRRFRFTFESFSLLASVQDHILESRWGIDFYYASNQVCHMSETCSSSLLLLHEVHH